ncbi:hypothetical protein GCM10020255_101030 [Rhodococcus baikonurensis]
MVRVNAAGSSTPTASTGVTELPAGGPNALAVTLGLLGDEWNLWILRFALLGSRRYNDWLALGESPTPYCPHGWRS